MIKKQSESEAGDVTAPTARVKAASLFGCRLNVAVVSQWRRALAFCCHEERKKQSKLRVRSRGKNKSLRDSTNVSGSPSLPPPLRFSPSAPPPPPLSSSGSPPASSRPDQDVGGIQRDQRQEAAGGEPQTHRNGESGAEGEVGRRVRVHYSAPCRSSSALEDWVCWG